MGNVHSHITAHKRRRAAAKQRADGLYDLDESFMSQDFHDIEAALVERGLSKPLASRVRSHLKRQTSLVKAASIKQNKCLSRGLRKSRSALKISITRQPSIGSIQPKQQSKQQSKQQQKQQQQQQQPPQFQPQSFVTTNEKSAQQSIETNSDDHEDGENGENDEDNSFDIAVAAAMFPLARRRSSTLPTEVEIWKKTAHDHVASERRRKRRQRRGSVQMIDIPQSRELLAQEVTRSMAIAHINNHRPFSQMNTTASRHVHFQLEQQQQQLYQNGKQTKASAAMAAAVMSVAFDEDDEDDDYDEDALAGYRSFASQRIFDSIAGPPSAADGNGHSGSSSSSSSYGYYFTVSDGRYVPKRRPASLCLQQLAANNSPANSQANSFVHVDGDDVSILGDVIVDDANIQQQQQQSHVISLSMESPLQRNASIRTASGSSEPAVHSPLSTPLSPPGTYPDTVTSPSSSTSPTSLIRRKTAPGSSQRSTEPADLLRAKLANQLVHSLPVSPEGTPSHPPQIPLPPLPAAALTNVTRQSKPGRSQTINYGSFSGNNSSNSSNITAASAATATGLQRSNTLARRQAILRAQRDPIPGHRILASTLVKQSARPVSTRFDKGSGYMIDEYDDDSQAMNSSQQQQQQQQQQQRPFRIVTTGLPSSLSQPSSPVSFASTIVAATSPSAAMHQQQRSLTSSSTDDISPASTVGSTVDLVAQIATMTTKDSVADTTDGSLTRSSTVVVKRPVPMPAIDYSQFDTAFERAQEWGRQRISQMVWRNDIDD